MHAITATFRGPHCTFSEMAEAGHQQLAVLAGRYVDACCSVLTKISDTRSTRDAAALRALLLGLGRLFVPGVDLAALTAEAADVGTSASAQQQRQPRLPDRDEFLTESASRLRVSLSGDFEAAEDAQRDLAVTEQQLTATAAAAVHGNPAAALHAALHASGRFQLLAETLLAGALRNERQLLYEAADPTIPRLVSLVECQICGQHRIHLRPAGSRASGESASDCCAVVAGDWLLRLPGARALLEALFQQAPAAAALLALVSCVGLLTGF